MISYFCVDLNISFYLYVLTDRGAEPFKIYEQFWSARGGSIPPGSVPMLTDYQYSDIYS